MWFNPGVANPLSHWVLYFLERTLWIQFRIYVHGQFQNLSDIRGVDLRVSKEGKLINFAKEYFSEWKEVSKQAK